MKQISLRVCIPVNLLCNHPCRISSVIANGTFNNVAITNSGTSPTYVTGANGPVQVMLSGTASAYIGAASPAVAITGSTTGINKVYFDQGTCNVQVGAAMRANPKFYPT